MKIALLDDIESRLISLQNLVIAAGVYTLSLSFVARIPAPAFTFSFAYLPGTAQAQLMEHSTFWSLLSVLFSFPYIASYGLLMANLLHAELTTVKVPRPFTYAYVIALSYAVTALSENCLIFLSVVISPTYFFLIFASILGAFKSLFATAQLILAVVLVPLFLNSFVKNVGRDGRQRIKKAE